MQLDQIVICYFLVGAIVAALVELSDTEVRTGSWIGGCIFALVFWPLIVAVVVMDLCGLLGE